MNCLYCNAVFTPINSVQKYCCESHQRIHHRQSYVRPNSFTYVCLNCGKEYTTGYRDRDTYCSRECADTHREKRNCLYCGVEFMASVQQDQRYCSEVCSRRGNKGTIAPLGNKLQCPQCGNTFIRDHSLQAFCSAECRYQYTLDQMANDRIENHQEVEYICKECGSVFVPEFGNKHRAFCSDACRNRHGSRIGKVIRKARIRGAERIERFDPIEILCGDKWHCQLCGISTPKRLRGSIDDRAPELDHIVPLAMGGSHTRANTQCLCRKCNQKKGASMIGQLRLPG